MKSWTQILLSAVLFSTWLVPPHAFAQVQSVAKLAAAGADVGGKVLRAVVTPKNSIQLVDDTGAVALEIASPAADAAALAKAMPSSIAKQFKDAGKFVGKVATQKFFNFPKEAFGFFLSLGAVMTYDLIKKASENPVAYEQLIQSQMDPVGQIAFYAFMVANGVASEPFMNMIRNGKLNPRFAHFIVYGGMSIGMMASNIVHEVGHFPGLKQCAIDLMKMDVFTGKQTTDSVLDRKDDYKVCDQAAKAFNDKGRASGIMNTWAPGLMSLIASTFISGLLQSGLVAGKALVAKGSSKIVGVVLSHATPRLGSIIVAAGIQIGFIGIPGVGPVFQGIRLITPWIKFVGQLVIFNGVQFAIEKYITDSYSNHDLSGKMIEIDRSLLYSLSNIKTANWAPASSEDLHKKLEIFGNAMKGWRQMNLSHVLMSQSNWEQKFGQLSQMYRMADSFYTEFVGRIFERDFKYKAAVASGEYISILDRNFPLNGVTISKREDQPEDSTTFLEAPELIEERQIITIESALDKIRAPRNLKDEERQLHSRLAANLRSGKREEVGKTLDEINCFLRIKANSNCIRKTISNEYKTYLANLRKAFGDPKPIWQKGVGYLVAFNSTPSYKADIDKAFFAKSWNYISTPTFAESMIASMTFGPDLEKGETSIISNFGFKDIFKAPRIRNMNVAFSPLKPSSSTMAPTSDVHNTGVYNFISSGKNIRSSVLNGQAGTFREWWKKYPETEYMKAWLDYERIYQGNIAALIRKFYAEDTFAQSFNRGPVDNGILKSFQQETRLYLMILGEIMKDNHILVKGSTLPEEHFSPEQTLLNTGKNFDQKSLLAYLKLNTSMDLPAYLKAEKISFLPKLDQGKQRNLIWQDQILARFGEVEKSVKKLRVQDIKIPTGEIKEMPVSTINRAELTQAADSAQEYLKQIAEQVFKNQYLHAEQAKVAQLCITGLGNILNEMTTLAEIADSASYVPRHNQQGHTSKRCLHQQTAQSSMTSIQRVQRAAEGCE